MSYTGQVSTRDALKLREKALEGLGLLFIAQPSALLESSASAAMKSALRPTSAACLKLKALTNLLELLKVSTTTLCSGIGFHCPGKQLTTLIISAL